MRYLKILLLTSLITSSYAFTQEAETPPPTNLDKCEKRLNQAGWSR